MARVVIPILLLLISVSGARAQGRFLVEGRSGFLAGAAFIHQSDVDGLGGVLSGSLKGNVDVGFQIAHFSLEDGQSLDSYTEFFQGHVSKPTLVKPYGFTINLAFEQGRHHRPAADLSPASTTSTSAMLMGGEVVLAVYGEGRWDVYPFMGVSMVMAKVGSIDVGWSRPVHFGMALVFDDRAVFEITATEQDGWSQMVASLGFIF